MNNLRSQAKAAADQIRSLKGQGEAGEMMDSYLDILDNFLKETTPGTPTSITRPSTNSATSGIQITR